MFRIRRYRVFIIFAVITIGALYHFTSLGQLQSAGGASVEGLKNFGQRVDSIVPPPATKPDAKDEPDSNSLAAAVSSSSLGASESSRRSHAESESPRPTQAPAIVKKPEESAAESSTATTTANDEDAVNPKATPVEKHAPVIESIAKSSNKTSKPETGPADPIIDGGGARLEIIAETGIPKIHWSQMPEHFPVPTENLIQLPTGKPKAIPKIQHEFAAESADERANREEKRDKIKKAFTFSWAGYKKKAWMQDELSPVSGKFRNPFCAWGATLVDSLDTLYMMGLEEEFEEAVEAVKEIDFTTSPRNDIPLFETVIRYLGGLVSAYDISNGAHRILLDKAVELANILMGAFDTPNRMPMTFYLWKPTFASQPHRAKTRVVLAELGSLSVEFTRLAQITKEAKYYDAIARITNEFEAWQNNTRMPGLWPMKVDASGCKKPDASPHTAYDQTPMSGVTNSKPLGFHDSQIAKSPRVLDKGASKKPIDDESDKDIEIEDDGDDEDSEAIKPPLKKPVGNEGDSSTLAAQAPSKVAAAASPAGNSEGTVAANGKGAIGKRDTGDSYGNAYRSGAASKPPECEPQGLASPPFTSTEEFTIGGQADSTYEYLPKEYMLLGGLEDKYRTMYETSADVITKDLLYRTMIPDEKRRILHPGLAKVADKTERIEFKPEGSHLGCFAGGMYAVGAKIFGREGDMKIAKELTDGCVWAYEVTTTGIMPDGYLAVQCPDPVNCPWNETFYHEKLDPFGNSREQNRLAQQQSLLEAGKENIVKDIKGPTSQIGPFGATSTFGAADSLPRNVNTEGQSAPAKAATAPQQSPETVASPARADNNIFKSAEGTPDKLTPIPEQSAEHPASLPAGGATVEQPISPPPGGAAASPKPRAKRQLGEMGDTPAAAAPPAELDNDPPVAPAAETSNGGAVNKTASEPVPAKPHENGAGARQPNSTTDAQHPVPQVSPYTSPPIPTHEEFVKARIKNERLPTGMTKVTGPRYLLRPEAIESVFIMYRATGDLYWREKGWEMFKAIEKHTNATFGGSAIMDVTSEEPVRADEMESFWLAETLKYFYLLFSEPSLVSLDEYVLNTEAHPFKRPS